MAKPHVIELNGNKYDALTGRVIADSSSPQHHSAPNLGLDGFATTRSRAAAPMHTPHTTKIHHKPERSHTLMRTSVKKPVAHPVHSVTAHPRRPSSVAAPIHSNNTVSPATTHINPVRVARAQHTLKSGLVSKFGYGSAHPVTIAEVPVKQAPHRTETAPPSASSFTALHAAGPHNKNPFETALQNATSHEQPKLRKTRLHHKVARKLHIAPRTLFIGIGGVSVLVIGGFLAYTRVPNVAMRVASTKAGIHATLPAYQPAGFSLRGPIASNPGEISVNYQSNSDNRDFRVVQRSSSWNSETLLDNFISATKKSYQTFQSNGRTIYIYDGGNATWVDGGIWYQIEGKSSLNSDQLLRIANSL